MMWEYMSKKIAVMVPDDANITDARIKQELDGPGVDGWELVSVADESGAYVRAFYKRPLVTSMVLT